MRCESRRPAGGSVVLIACGFVICVPLALTLYLSVFDEKLILFPPRGYTLSWYGAIMPNFGGAMRSRGTAAASVAGSLLLGVPAGIASVAPRSAASAC